MANLVEQGATQIFGHYQVLGVLGEGSLGRLHLAEYRGTEGGAAIVALRTFHPQLTANPHFVKTLPDVVRVSGGLRHPNIAATHEFGEFDGSYFLTGEYLPGESLSSILAKCASSPMPPAIAAALVHQCAEALRYAHEVRDLHGTQLRVVHRDIRPANVFVTYQGMVKVVGAGAGPLREMVLEIRGAGPDAFAYTAPEGLDGGVPDVRTDIFSMGVVLWECLTGRPLFHAETATKARDAARSRYVEPPSVLNAAVPPGLDEVALRALSRDPRRRYQTAKEMSVAIDTAILGLGRRPTSAAIAEWLERLFGPERATLKTQIARGSAVPGALARLRLLGGDPPPAGGRLSTARFPALPPPGGSTPGDEARPVGRLSVSAPPTPTPPPFSVPDRRISVPAMSTVDSANNFEDEGRPLTPRATSAMTMAAISPASPPPARGFGVGGLAAVGVALLVVVGVALLAFRGDGTGSARSSQTAAVSVGSLQIVSTPPGAQVLIDGDPSGLATPARVSGLRAGRKVEIRVDKPGYRSEKQLTDVPASGARTLSFTLVESMGTLRLEGIPGQATTYIDDAVVDGNQPLSLPVGPHRLRVEVAGRLHASMKIDVRPGAQRLLVHPTEGNSP